MRLTSALAKLDPLVLDDLGYVPASNVGAEILSELASTAHERTTLILNIQLGTSNPGPKSPDPSDLPE